MLQNYQAELMAVRDNSAEFARRKAELAHFHNKVTWVLEEKFYPENYRSVCAILCAVPMNGLKAIYEAWLDELALLGTLKWETVAYYKGQYDNQEIFKPYA